MEYRQVIFVLYQGGVTGDTVLNVIHGNRDAKDKKALNYREEVCGKTAMKAADIFDQMTLGKVNVEELEDIEDADKRMGGVGNLTKPSMAEMLVMYRKTLRFQAAKETLWLDLIVPLNALGDLKNGAVV